MGQAMVLRVDRRVALRSEDALHGDRADQACSEALFLDGLFVSARVREATVGNNEDGIFEARLRKGLADICVDCRGPISEARRKAIKKTIRCVDCQAKKTKS